jgi:3-methyladenine DNA glycosylase AlkD
MTPKQFVTAVEHKLIPLTDPALAKPMAAYMKDQFEFLGIKTPARRVATKTLIRQQREEVMGCAETLWTLPYREYQYVACDLLERHAKSLPAAALARVTKLAAQKSWWDTVDALAKVAGTILQNFPELIARMETLATHRNMWLRRVAILHQLGYGSETDIDRLFRLCLANAADPEFFIRKAIGWALRQTAHHDPAAIRKFLKQQSVKFSNLTLREAGKHL